MNDGGGAANRAAASSSRARSAASETPARPLGTRSKAVSAERPADGSPRNRCAPISRAVVASGVPGSVTMTKRRPRSCRPASSKACKKARRWPSVSAVAPDLSATTTAVRSRRSARAARTSCGSVVSSTRSGTPSVRVIASAASDGPPMPHSTTCSRPRARSSARTVAISGNSARLCSKTAGAPEGDGANRERASIAAGTDAAPKTVSPAAAATSSSRSDTRHPLCHSLTRPRAGRVKNR